MMWSLPTHLLMNSQNSPGPQRQPTLEALVPEVQEGPSAFPTTPPVHAGDGELGKAHGAAAKKNGWKRSECEIWINGHWEKCPMPPHQGEDSFYAGEFYRRKRSSPQPGNDAGVEWDVVSGTHARSFNWSRQWDCLEHSHSQKGPWEKVNRSISEFDESRWYRRPKPSSASPQGTETSSGAGLIEQERQRQIEKEGWDSEHDDDHEYGILAKAGALYAMEAYKLQMHECQRLSHEAPDGWPWDEDWWKPSPNPIRNLIKAGALIAAEIDRLIRAGIDPELRPEWPTSAPKIASAPSNQDAPVTSPVAGEEGKGETADIALQRRTEERNKFADECRELRRKNVNQTSSSWIHIDPSDPESLPKESDADRNGNVECLYEPGTIRQWSYNDRLEIDTRRGVTHWRKTNLPPRRGLRDEDAVYRKWLENWDANNHDDMPTLFEAFSAGAALSTQTKGGS